jgi:hypothetical protein
VVFFLLGGVGRMGLALLGLMAGCVCTELWLCIEERFFSILVMNEVIS